MSDEGLLNFWKFWRQHKRHTDGIGKCRKAYHRQIAEGATDEDLLLGAHYHVRNTKDMAYLPLAASWLNGELWIDEAPKERAWLSRQIAQSENVVQIQQPKSKWLQEFERKRMESQE